MSTSNTSDSTVKQLTEGLTAEWIMDGQIVIFTVRDLSRHVSDIWVKELDEMLKTWPVDRPYLSLYDVNFPGASLSPYTRSRVSAVLKKYQSLTGRTAIVLPRSVTMTLFQLLLRATAFEKRQRRIFESREQAMDWLTEALSESKA